MIVEATSTERCVRLITSITTTKIMFHHFSEELIYFCQTVSPVAQLPIGRSSGCFGGCAESGFAMLCLSEE